MSTKKVINIVKATVFQYGLFFDLFILCSFYFLNRRYCTSDFLKNRDDIKDLTNCLIGTFVSISGFSLAALTIIITIRSNVLSKENKSHNLLESLFKSSLYFQVTKIFKWIIVEQALSAICLFLSWTFFRVNSSFHSSVLLGASYILFISLLRLFFILFLILDSEKITKPGKPLNIPQSKF